MTYQLGPLLKRLMAIDGYPFDITKDGPLLNSLLSEFPAVDFNEELARLDLWLADLRPGIHIHYRLLLRKWIVNASRKSAATKESPPQ